MSPPHANCGLCGRAVTIDSAHGHDLGEGFNSESWARRTASRHPLDEPTRAPLPSRKEGTFMRCGVRGRGATAAHAACTERAPTQGLWGPGHARSAPRTCCPCS
eukprot:scaffold63097_cov63-Phaeocystis_antarctica.AAC.2